MNPVTRGIRCTLVPAVLVAGTALAPTAAQAVPAAPSPSIGHTITDPGPGVTLKRATPTASERAKIRKARRAKALGVRLVRTAAAQAGDPYRYGASGPNAFDCSGLTKYVAARNGKKLPRTSAAQRGATKRIKARDRRRGDLVFFHDGGRVYHVAIYAGAGKVWHAPYSGTRVRKERIWTKAVSYGRIR